MLKEGREVVDGEFQTACSNACSNGAMVLGMLTIKEVKLRN
jgi:molybdopterin-containing oxidoreductase family iron-sulfur binding subunit